MGPLFNRRDYKSKRFVGDKVGDDRFRRIIYFSKVQNLAMIHYLGDENIALEIPHGTSVHKTQSHRQTLKSTLSDLKSKCIVEEPRSVYQNSVSKLGINASEQGVLN